MCHNGRKKEQPQRKGAGAGAKPGKDIIDRERECKKSGFRKRERLNLLCIDAVGELFGGNGNAAGMKTGERIVQFVQGKQEKHEKGKKTFTKRRKQQEKLISANKRAGQHQAGNDRYDTDTER